MVLAITYLYASLRSHAGTSQMHHLVWKRALAEQTLLVTYSPRTFCIDYILFLIQGRLINKIPVRAILISLSENGNS